MLTEELKKELTASALEKYKVPKVFINNIIAKFEPIIDKHIKIAKQSPMLVRFKDRVPDPGSCLVLMINWETKEMEVSNGAIRLYPKFDEVYYVE